MSEKDAPERTLSDVGLRPASQVPSSGTLDADVWFPNGTRNTRGSWVRPSLGFTHFWANGKLRPLCRRKATCAGAIVRTPVSSLDQFCPRCLSMLGELADADAALDDAKAVSP